ncbi:MAG: purine-nucleoside phosphorylase [Candidatus Omnitrophica bacterium]|nr:purine-nucleoside phosphorylase [Candidatus Omnitrophota bacterium]
MSTLPEKIDEALVYLKGRVKKKPDIAIILGTGLGALAKKITNRKTIEYSEIPHFPVSTAPGHKGALVFGKIGRRNVIAMEGRFHFYEGWTLEEVTFGVRVAKALGAKVLIVSNAAGGMNPHYKPGDLAIITDHINLMGVNPLIGPHDDSLGLRFPDMSEPYDRQLIALAKNIGLEEKISLKEGVYVGVTGPNLETAAEYRFLRMIGADIVGMSTVPEVIVGVQSGMRIFGVSCITDTCLPDALKPANIEEIIRVAEKAEPLLSRLVLKIIEKVKI